MKKYLIKNRRCIGMSLLGVIICAVSVGVFKLAALGVDPFQWLIPQPSMVIRIICLVVGIVVICFGSALYMTADLGVSTYDAVAIVMSGKWHWGKFKYIRIATDLGLVIGFVMYRISRKCICICDEV